jgi:diamine N-acetyltransferase
MTQMRGFARSTPATSLPACSGWWPTPETPEYWLARLMIAGQHQQRGVGRAALELLAEHVRTLPGARELVTSCVPGHDGPLGFYLGLGFVPTGEVSDGEDVLRLTL